MADIGALVARLVGAGCDAGVAASVVAEVFTAGVLSADFRGQNVDETAERRRAKDRDRKRLLRGLPQTSADIGGLPQTALTLSSSTNSVVKKEKKERARKQPLSADFRPKESHFEAAAKFGKPPQFVRDKFEDMRIWALSKGELRDNWDMTLHGFIRRDAKKEGPNGQPGNIIQAADHLVSTIRSFDAGPGDPDEIRSGAGAAPVRLLSKG